jgi:hypothetical protein
MTADRALITKEPPDLLLSGSAKRVEAGAGPGQSGQYAQPVKPEGIPPSCQSTGSTEHTFVPVSMAAHDWKVTPRRIRHLLSTGRLEGRQGVNGYWEVGLPLPVPLQESWCMFKTLSDAGMEVGMRHLDSLTGSRQFVNMGKLSMIFRSHKIPSSPNSE